MKIVIIGAGWHLWMYDIYISLRKYPTAKGSLARLYRIRISGRGKYGRPEYRAVCGRQFPSCWCWKGDEYICSPLRVRFIYAPDNPSTHVVPIYMYLTESMNASACWWIFMICNNVTASAVSVFMIVARPFLLPTTWVPWTHHRPWRTGCMYHSTI
jgi:hypothetical protein